MVTACGRIGFTGLGDDGDGGIDGGVEVPADLAALACETDHAMLGMIPLSDRIRVVHAGGYPYAIDIHHVTDSLHEVHAYRIGQRDGALLGTDLGVVYTLPEIAGLAVEPDGTDIVMFLTAPLDDRTRLIRFDATFATVGDTSLGDFALGQPPYAKSSAGRLVVGSTSGDVLQARSLDATFMPTAPAVTIGSPAYGSTIAPAGADFIVAWSGNGACSFARVNATGSVVAGPVIVDPGTTCTAPAVAALASGGFAFVVHDMIGSNLYEAFGGTLTAGLALASGPTALGATPSFAEQLVVSGDVVRIPLFNNGTIQIIEMTAAGAMTQIGADIGAVGYDAVWIEQVAGASLLFRIENKRLVVRKLCR